MWHFRFVDWEFSVFPPLGRTFSMIGGPKVKRRKSQHHTAKLASTKYSIAAAKVLCQHEDGRGELREPRDSRTQQRHVLDHRRPKKTHDFRAIPFQHEVSFPHEAGMGQKNTSGKKKIRKKAF